MEVHVHRGGEREVVPDVSAVGIGHKVQNLVLVMTDGTLRDIPEADWTAATIHRVRRTPLKEDR
jgi:hypothetical protein